MIPILTRKITIIKVDNTNNKFNYIHSVDWEELVYGLFLFIASLLVGQAGHNNKIIYIVE